MGRLDGVVDYIEAKVTGSIWWRRIFCKERQADLPCGGVGTKLVNKVEGLFLQLLRAGWVPGDVDSIFKLVDLAS